MDCGMNDCFVLFLERAGYRNLLPEGIRSKVIKSGCFEFAKKILLYSELSLFRCFPDYLN
jgi:hypothetical protein